MGVPWRSGNSVATPNKGKKTLDVIQRDYTLLSDLAIWILAFIVLAFTLVYVNTGLVVRWNWEEKRGWGGVKV